MPKNFRKRRTSSSSEDDDKETSEETNETNLSAKEKIEELKFIQKQRERTHGIDVYSLAIGEQEAKLQTKQEQIDNDPWKKKTGGLVDIKVLKEKRGNEIVTSMTNNFARETNQRDEDAEMQKFIDEQVQLKKQAEKQAELLNEKGTPIAKIEDKNRDSNNQFKRPEDVLFDLPKFLIENKSKHRSEESLSEQMLSGIPEVDLGVTERIRNIEETEQAKKSVTTSQSSSSMTGKLKNSQYASHNIQCSFVQHKRFDDALINPDNMIKPRINKPSSTTVKNDQPVVGDAPKHELLQQSDNYQAYNKPNKKFTKSSSKPNPNARRQYHVSTNEVEFEKQKSEAKTDSTNTTDQAQTSKPDNDANKRPHKRSNPTEKASDDYCLERFKKNMRQNRSSKIKIA